MLRSQGQLDPKHSIKSSGGGGRGGGCIKGGGMH